MGKAGEGRDEGKKRSDGGRRGRSDCRLKHFHWSTKINLPSYTQMASLLYANVNEPSSERFSHKPITGE